MAFDPVPANFGLPMIAGADFLPTQLRIVDLAASGQVLSMTPGEWAMKKGLSQPGLP